MRERSADAAEPAGITRIERILQDPEQAAAEIELAPRVEDDGDYDSAVRGYYRDVGITVTCKNHPDTAAVDQCPECQAYYCQACMVVRRGRLLCRDCAVSLFVPTEEEVLTAEELGEEGPPEVAPEEKPEFQVGSMWLGLEGRPSHPAKKMVALLIDMVITRGLVLLLALAAGFFLSHQPGAFFHLFDKVEGEATVQRVYFATVLFQPMMPWLVIFAVLDYIYFFTTLSFFNRTLGMSWLGCRLVTEWGDFVGFGAVALRTLVFMICLGWPAILLSGLFPAHRGPHDYAAGTLVINYSGNKRVDSYDTVQIKLA